MHEHILYLENFIQKVLMKKKNLLIKTSEKTNRKNMTEVMEKGERSPARKREKTPFPTLWKR